MHRSPSRSAFDFDRAAMKRLMRLVLVALLVAVSAQPSPRRRSPPYDDRRRSFDDRRRTFDDRRRSYDDRRRSYDDRRRYIPPAPPPDPCFVPNCATCVVPTVCIRCMPGFTSGFTTGFGKFPGGGGILPGLACAACGANCSRCDTAGAGSCDKNGCKSYFTNVNGSCKACSSFCNCCDSAGAGDCDDGRCIFRYGKKRTGKGCGPCTPHCYGCSISGAANCDAGKCDPTYTNDGHNCTSCGSFCTSCNLAGPGLCDECDRTYFADNDKTCKACAKNCNSCTDASNQGCVSCTGGYEFNKKHKCVQVVDYSWMIPAGVGAVVVLGLCVWAICHLRSGGHGARDAYPLLRQQQMSVRTSTRSASLPSLPLEPVWSVPSGAWRGYYTYAGRNHDVCEFQLQFLNGNVQGRGVDDVGGYTINGTFDGRSHSIQFIKQYQRGTRNQSGFVSEDNEGHKVAYTGRLVGQNLGAGFRGSWAIRNFGTNSDGIFHLWPAMESWASASAPPLEEPTPQVFQVAEDGEYVVCLDRPITTCLRPCGHIAMCSQCADRLQRSTGTCPICRSHIQSILVMRNGEVHPSAAQALRT